jgi:purine-binding chemotaxis protein CheW
MSAIAEQTQLAAVFRRRAAQLARRGRQDATRLAGVPILVLRAAGEGFGIELEHVKQVFPRVEVTPVPGAPHALVGVANLDGVPRSVFELSRLLNLRPCTSNTPFIVLLNVRGKVMGLAVEAVEEVRRFEGYTLKPVEEAADDSAKEFTKGMTDDRIAVLDADSLLQQALQRPEAQAGEQTALAGASG